MNMDKLPDMSIKDALEQNLLIEIEECAIITGFSIFYCRNLARKGALPAVKVRGKWYFHKDRLEKLFKLSIGGLFNEHTENNSKNTKSTKERQAEHLKSRHDFIDIG